MKISMEGKFQILKDDNPLTKTDVKDLSLGGYYFIIDHMEVPFDWTDWIGNENESVFSFETGFGMFGNHFELDDCYDNDYEKLGISREDITAEFLSSVSEIYEFHVNFMNKDNEEVDFGDNSDDQYKIRLLKLSFFDVSSGSEYNVKQAVLENFNKKTK